MNIAKEDIVSLEKRYGEEPAKGMVWQLAKAGYTTWDIDDIMKRRSLKDVRKDIEYGKRTD